MQALLLDAHCCVFPATGKKSLNSGGSSSSVYRRSEK